MLPECRVPGKVWKNVYELIVSFVGKLNVLSLHNVVERVWKSLRKVYLSKPFGVLVLIYVYIYISNKQWKNVSFYRTYPDSDFHYSFHLISS